MFWYTASLICHHSRAARMWNRATFRTIMIACVIMHNMIMEDERAKDEEDLDVKEVDPMNPRKARIYERPNDEEFEIVGRDGQNLEVEHEY
ncbi:unnamed protein product [Prunus armeniaca]